MAQQPAVAAASCSAQINYYCKTDIDEAKVISAHRHKSKFNFELIWKKNSNFWVPMLQYSRRPFHWCISYWCRTDIDEAMVISALQHKSKFEFRTLKNQIFGFPWCSTRKDLSIDVSITNVGLILTKLWWFLFTGYGQMDRQTQFWNPHMETFSAHKKFQLKTKN